MPAGDHREPSQLRSFTVDDCRLADALPPLTRTEFALDDVTAGELDALYAAPTRDHRSVPGRPGSAGDRLAGCRALIKPTCGKGDRDPPTEVHGARPTARTHWWALPRDAEHAGDLLDGGGAPLLATDDN